MRRLVLFALLFVGSAAPILAPRPQEPPAWPHWGGPDRDFASDVRLASSWVSVGPQELWRRPLPNGHSGMVVADDAVYTVHGGKLEETALALDAGTGEQIWKRTYPVGYVARVPGYDGPHATPALTGDVLITVGIDATVRALDRYTGAVRWRADLRARHAVELPQFGYAPSPLVVEGLVLLPGLGGAAPAAIALRLTDGSTAWARHEFRSSHASPTLIERGGVPQAIFHGMDWMYALAPDTGEVLWRFRLRRNAADNVSFTPLWDAVRGQLLVTHGFDSQGAQGIALDAEGAAFALDRRWNNGRLQVRHGNGVLVGRMLVGSHTDIGVVTAIDVDDGATLWRERMPKATFLRAGNLLLVLDETGALHLARPTRDGLGVISTRQVLEPLAWTIPTLVGDRLYARDREQIVALRLP